MEKITVIGAGSWGTVLANMLALKGHTVTLWAYETETVQTILKTGVNETFMPELKLSPNVKPTNDINVAVDSVKYVIFTVPSQFLRKVLSLVESKLSSEAILVTAVKGIEKVTLMTASTIIRDFLPNEIAALSGPSFANEVALKKPAAVSLGVTNDGVGHTLQDIFNTEYFRVYTNDDIVGVELGGALKNVIAIASGISDGLSLGFNARAALITRGLSEIVRLGVKMGARERTFSGLSGIGDLVLTCTGALSRNYSVGKKLGIGMTPDEIVKSMKAVAEGVETSLSAYELSVKHAVEMPIVEQVYKVIHHGKDPGSAVKELMSRELKREF
ncbi:NAD(P)H-dependent glycerol-3-phosphate dehydrogenase [Candidatus Magnetomonas plexicatena]|uniref:NAD(P)H-dependent glycerol-3-phosphate dehydrogenase n=1 Tax=Candidatus Magnetomonas plexicatena TaxID=2552947 RepID=UPI001C750416|nr:NAD(P)-dependent glycerol-3-phosphate dehydrogenase [Nitrospirales bacterium LBB_01]